MKIKVVSIYIYKKVAVFLTNEVKSITGFVQGQFPFQYSGYLVTHARKRKAYYNDLIKKVKSRLQN